MCNRVYYTHTLSGEKKTLTNASIQRSPNHLRCCFTALRHIRWQRLRVTVTHQVSTCQGFLALFIFAESDSGAGRKRLARENDVQLFPLVATVPLSASDILSRWRRETCISRAQCASHGVVSNAPIVRCPSQRCLSRGFSSEEPRCLTCLAS